MPKALWVWKGLLSSLNLVSIDADMPVWITQTKDTHTPACTSPVTTVIVQERSVHFLQTSVSFSNI